MFNISALLQKFSKQIGESESEKEQIHMIIFKHTGLEIKKNLFEIKNYILYIDVSPVFKNKIFMYKRNILEDMSHSLSVKIVDIR